LLDIEYTSLFHKKYVIAAEKTQWVSKAKTPKG